MQLVFSQDDFSRVPLARDPDPLWEVALGVRALRLTAPPPAVRRWRRTVCGRLPAPVAPLLELVPDASGFPDFLTPELADGSVGARVEALLDTPTSTIRHQVGAERRHVHTHALASGDIGAQRALGRAVRAFLEHTLGAFRREREAWWANDRGHLADQLTDRGVERTLSSLGRGFVWSDRRLSYRPAERAGDSEAILTSDLGGRGLVMYPSRFTTDPVLLDVPAGGRGTELVSQVLLGEHHFPRVATQGKWRFTRRTCESWDR